MHYVVVVTTYDSGYGLGNYSSDWYGPFKSREKAELQAKKAEGSTTNHEIRSVVIKLTPGPVPRFAPEPNYN